MSVLNYQQWDFLADSYIPILLLITIVKMSIRMSKLGTIVGLKPALALCASVFLVYLLLFIDNRLALWPGFNLDYSTHTALALVFVTYFCFQSPMARSFAATSLILYGLLMLYQQYHSLNDILSTAIVVGPMIFFIQFRFVTTELIFSKGVDGESDFIGN